MQILLNYQIKTSKNQKFLFFLENLNFTKNATLIYIYFLFII